jgi:hypothetical protein
VERKVLTFKCERVYAEAMGSKWATRLRGNRVGRLRQRLNTIG